MSDSRRHGLLVMDGDAVGAAAGFLGARSVSAVGHPGNGSTRRIEISVCRTVVFPSAFAAAKKLSREVTNHR
jgi:hypothetical protein